MRRYATRIPLAIALCGVLLGLSSLEARAAALREYEIKAGYLAKFIEYIEWPAVPQASADAVIHLCMLGDDPFGPAIAPLRGKSIEGRTLQVRRATLQDAGGCELLFISPSESERLGEILGELRGSPVLIISEVEGSAERGVIINFVEERNRVRFEINAEAARRNGFTISSQLLKLARLVEP